MLCKSLKTLLNLFPPRICIEWIYLCVCDGVYTAWGMHTAQRSDILSSRNQFSSLFFPWYSIGRSGSKTRAWNQSTNLVLLLISYRPSKTRKGFLDPSHHYVSIQRIHRIIFFLLFNGRRCSADDYIGAREKRSNSQRRRRKVPNQKPIDPNVSVSGRDTSLSLCCWEAVHVESIVATRSLVDAAIGQQLIHSNQRLLCYSFTADSAGIDIISKSQRDQTNR